MVAAADPLAWTRAPLFIAQSERSAAADPLPAERASSDASATPAVRDVSAIVPQSGGLSSPAPTIGPRDERPRS
jgi:hypothetical protein